MVFSKEKILVSICARGGSKGLKNKNILNLCGRPLITYTISIAKSVKRIFNSDIGISSDNKDIIDIAKKNGLNTDYIRPNNLATDETGKVETIKHLLQHEEKKRNLKYDYILDLDVSSPMRTLEDIMQSFSILKSNEKAMNIFSVNSCNRNPYFNMVEKNRKTGFYNLVKKPLNVAKSRQKSPKVYDMNASLYWFRRKFFEKNYISQITNHSLIYEMNHICFDIDNKNDFDYMSYIFENKKFKLEL